jgi:hypothetical protein
MKKYLQTADYSKRTQETGDRSKNGANPKNLTSKGLKKVIDAKNCLKMVTMIIATIIVNPACVQLHSSSEEYKAAKSILATVASGDVEKFNWLNLDDIRSLHACGFRDELEELVKDKKKNILPVLRNWRHEGKEAGIDWSDYAVDKVEYETGYDESLGVKVAYGNIFITGNNKQFKIYFERGIIGDNGKWKFIDLQDFEQIENTSGQVTKGNVKLIQDKDFDTFILSLADCYAAKDKHEIEKIVLFDNNRKKVIKLGYYTPLEYIDIKDLFTDKTFGEDFREAVKSHNYTSEEQRSAQLLEWFEEYALNEDELFNNSIVYEFKCTGGLSGIYFSYKGKWYLWQITLDY